MLQLLRQSRLGCNVAFRHVLAEYTPTLFPAVTACVVIFAKTKLVFFAAFLGKNSTLMLQFGHYALD